MAAAKKSGEFWKIGHRGAAAHAPENTLLSIRRAIELGSQAVEFDIQLSKDGVPVVIHDPTLRRTTSGHGLVSDFTVKELQTLDAGHGEKIPTLRNVLDMVDKRARMFVELKAEGSAAPVAEVIEEYVHRHGWSYEQFYVCAFNHLLLTEIDAIDPDIYTCVLFVGIPAKLAQIAVDAGACAINPHIDHVNQALVDDAHKRGLKVFPWTANRRHDIARVKALGVDGIISDFPDRL